MLDQDQRLTAVDGAWGLPRALHRAWSDIGRAAGWRSPFDAASFRCHSGHPRPLVPGLDAEGTVDASTPDLICSMEMSPYARPTSAAARLDVAPPCNRWDYCPALRHPRSR